jgi:GAF domain-containing protein
MAGIMGERFALLNDTRLHAVQPLVTARVRELAALAGESGFDEFFDTTMRALLVSALECVGAHEGTVWLLDETRTALVPRFNNGPNAANFVGSFHQPLHFGMISMVVSTEQPICENEVYQNQQQDKRLDRTLGLLTCAMLATPLYFGGELRGVISAVQLKPAHNHSPEPPGFTAEHLEALQLVAAVLSRLVDQQLLALALGLEDFA